jgi:predicted nucleic acid-binding protein
MPDEGSAETASLLDALTDGSAIAPDVITHEIRNVIVNALRSGRMKPGVVAALTRDLSDLPIIIAGPGDTASVIELAHRRALTSYDASYLQLAISTRLPLATLDRRLRSAAVSEGVAILPCSPLTAPAVS